MLQQDVSFQNKQGKIYTGTLRIPREREKYPAVLICHGFLENKDVGLIADIANGLSYYGFVTFRFNFLFEGDVSKAGYEEMTLSQMVEDIRYAVEYLRTVPQVDTRRMILFGHDLGGVTCLLSNTEEIDGIILLNVRMDLKAFLFTFVSEQELKDWMRSGWLTLLGVNLHRDFYKDLMRYNVLKEIKDEKIPILVIHGADNQRCPVEEARVLFRNARNAHLELIEGGDHYLSDPEHKLYTIGLMAKWINNLLGM